MVDLVQHGVLPGESASAAGGGESGARPGVGDESATAAGEREPSPPPPSQPSEGGWRPPSTQELGLAADTIDAADGGVTLGFGIARKATNFGFGCARFVLNNIPGLGEGDGNPVSGGLHGIVGAAEAITHFSQDFGQGVTQVCLRGVNLGLDAAGAERGTLALKGLEKVIGEEEAGACVLVIKAAREFEKGRWNSVENVDSTNYTTRTQHSDYSKLQSSQIPH